MRAMNYGGEQAGVISTDDLLWPSFSGPSQLAAIERVRLSDRGRPASTYELVRRVAELWPDRPAVSVLPDAESFHTPLVRTFGELACDVHRAAAVLAELGVDRGDAVAVVSVNCAELLPLLLAAEAIGVYAPINPGLAPVHAAELVRLSGARVIAASGPELDEGVWAHARTNDRCEHRRASAAGAAPDGSLGRAARARAARRRQGRLPARADGGRSASRPARNSSGRVGRRARLCRFQRGR